MEQTTYQWSPDAIFGLTGKEVEMFTMLLQYLKVKQFSYDEFVFIQTVDKALQDMFNRNISLLTEVKLGEDGKPIIESQQAEVVTEQPVPDTPVVETPVITTEQPA